MVWQGSDTWRGAHGPNALEQLVKGHVPPTKRPQGAGCSSRQQDGSRTGSHHSALQHDKGPAQHPHTLDIRSAPVAPNVFLPFRVVLLENWGSGTALSPVGQSRAGEMPSHSEEEEPWTRVCRSASFWSVLLFMALLRNTHGP